MPDLDIFGGLLDYQIIVSASISLVICSLDERLLEAVFNTVLPEVCFDVTTMVLSFDLLCPGTFSFPLASFSRLSSNISFDLPPPECGSRYFKWGTLLDCLPHQAMIRFSPSSRVVEELLPLLDFELGGLAVFTELELRFRPTIAIPDQTSDFNYDTSTLVLRSSDFQGLSPIFADLTVLHIGSVLRFGLIRRTATAVVDCISALLLSIFPEARPFPDLRTAQANPHREDLVSCSVSFVVHDVEDEALRVFQSLLTLESISSDFVLPLDLDAICPLFSRVMVHLAIFSAIGALELSDALEIACPLASFDLQFSLSPLDLYVCIQPSIDQALTQIIETSPFSTNIEFSGLLCIRRLSFVSPSETPSALSGYQPFPQAFFTALGFVHPLVSDDIFTSMMRFAPMIGFRFSPRCLDDTFTAILCQSALPSFCELPDLICRSSLLDDKYILLDAVGLIISCLDERLSEELFITVLPELCFDAPRVVMSLDLIVHRSFSLSLAHFSLQAAIEPPALPIIDTGLVGFTVVSTIARVISSISDSSLSERYRPTDPETLVGLLEMDAILSPFDCRLSLSPLYFYWYIDLTCTELLTGDFDSPSLSFDARFPDLSPVFPGFLLSHNEVPVRTPLCDAFDASFLHSFTFIGSLISTKLGPMRSLPPLIGDRKSVV
jgi:hypothetical protein